MRPFAHRFLDEHRVRRGPLASDESAGNNRSFLIPRKGLTLTPRTIAHGRRTVADQYWRLPPPSKRKRLPIDS
jgi:hypothetical protein